MNVQLNFSDDEIFHAKAISPLLELGAYEALWDQSGATFKRIADIFRDHPGSIPSDFVDEATASRYSEMALEAIKASDVRHFAVRVHNAGEYPQKLRDADHPIELLYYQGWWDLVDRPSVAVVGTRKPTRDGKSRARRIARLLVADGFTIVSGLASGIDTVAHTSAMEFGGYTIAVLGTPLTEVYPAANRDLQRRIADEHLVISQVPIIRYSSGNPRSNRMFFPERNVTMSALTRATVIVEAGETSGTLIQARHALKQGRQLLILESCFNRGLSWPEKLAAKGAIRVRDVEQLSEILRLETHSN